MYNFCKELEHISSEPFAVMLSAEWGSGKTSFMNILKGTIREAEFIEVEGGFEYDVESMLKDIEIQLQSIFMSNHFFTEKNGAMENYFEVIGNMVSNAGYGWGAYVINKLKHNNNEGYLKSKADINETLEMFYRKTQKKIFIVVDNLDRIFKDEVRERIFQVISECIRLKNCTTLFIADINKFSNSRMDQEFLEKYINHQLVLCDISFEEIVVKFKKEFLSDEFWDDKSDYIKENGLKLRNEFEKDITKKIDSIEAQIEKYKQNLEKENQEGRDREITVQNLDILNNAIKRLRIRMINPRKVKRFLATIESMLLVADTVWFQNQSFDKNEYSKCNWVKKIFEVAFLKSFLTEEYEAMILARDIKTFKENHERCHVVEYVIEGVSDFLSDPFKEEHTSLVVYRLYALNLNTDKTQHQKLIEEIDNDKMQEEYLQRYLEECLGINFNHVRLQKILNYIKNHEFQNPRFKIKIVLEIMDIVSKGYLNHASYDLQIQEKIERLVSQMEEKEEFASRDLNLIEHYKSVLQRRVIFQNNCTIRVFMELLHNAKFEQYLETNVDSIDQLYSLIVRINSEYPLKDFVIQEDKLTTMKQYFEKATIVLKNDEYAYIENEVNDLIKKINSMLSILYIWFYKSETYKAVSLLEGKLYMESIDMLFQWIADLKKYVQRTPTNMNNVGEAFMDMVFDIEKKMNNDIAWFGEKSSETIDIIKDTFDYLSQMHPDFERDYEERWKFIKIRLFRMQRIAEIV